MHQLAMIDPLLLLDLLDIDMRDRGIHVMALGQGRAVNLPRADVLDVDDLLDLIVGLPGMVQDEGAKREGDEEHDPRYE